MREGVQSYGERLLNRGLAMAAGVEKRVSAVTTRMRNYFNAAALLTIAATTVSCSFNGETAGTNIQEQKVSIDEPKDKIDRDDQSFLGHINLSGVAGKPAAANTTDLTVNVVCGGSDLLLEVREDGNPTNSAMAIANGDQQEILNFTMPQEITGKARLTVFDISKCGMVVDAECERTVEFVSKAKDCKPGNLCVTGNPVYNVGATVQ